MNKKQPKPGELWYFGSRHDKKKWRLTMIISEHPVGVFHSIEPTLWFVFLEKYSHNFPIGSCTWSVPDNFRPVRNKKHDNKL